MELMFLFYLYPLGVWMVDFEFRPAGGREGNPPEVVCMVAREFFSGRELRLWKSDLLKLKQPPFPTGEGALFVAYYSSAEMSCFLVLGWKLPTNILDLFIAFRHITNGLTVPSGNGLLGALNYFQLKTMDCGEKESMRNLILGGGPWSRPQRLEILNYCRSDVQALEKLLVAMRGQINWSLAKLHGRYAAALACIEHTGVPVDTPTLSVLKARWEEIKGSLITAVDVNYGVYEGATFKTERFAQYLNVNRIPWPRLDSGRLDLNDQTFKDMSQIHPQLTALRELRGALSQMRLSDLAVGDDDRSRCMLSMFRSRTGRNQPSSSRFIFGPSVWTRGLIKPKPGFALAYVDWARQEFGIGGALSDDERMRDAYMTGDPYLTFAKQAGAVPPDATKDSHKSIRDKFKACVLAVQYGMGAESLALRINQPVAYARELLSLHRRTYQRYWDWVDGVRDQALLGRRIWTSFGWQLFVEGKPNVRSLCNFPVQGNGSEMLRLACIKLVEDGIQVCAPVHDAILVEAPLSHIDEVVAHTQSVMRAASASVLNGFVLDSDVKIVSAPLRYMDDRGVSMWNTVMQVLGMPDHSVGLGLS
jgi:hypothetical protein